jgi:hypothetical protein
MKNIFSRSTTLAAALMLSALFSTSAFADGNQQCSNANLKGPYAVTLSGSVSGLPFSALDLATADGNGNISGTGTVAFNGVISDVTFTATYSVNADCSGSAVFDTGATQNFVLIGGGREIMLIKTDNGSAVVTGAGKNLHRAD